MKRNLVNRRLLALGVPLLLLVASGCKKEEERPKLTPMPKHPAPAQAQKENPPAAPAPAAPGAPATAAAPGTAGNAAPGAPARPAAPGAPGGAGKPVQQPLSSAVRTAPANQLSFRNRIDPFKPYAPIEPPPPAQAAQPQGKEERATRREGLLPIQSYEVTKFKVVGIIAGLKENKALIIDPTGKGYVVQAGMPLGANQGVITRITPNGVEVMETFKEGKGHVKKRKTVLTLAKKR